MGEWRQGPRKQFSDRKEHKPSRGLVEAGVKEAEVGAVCFRNSL